MLAPSGNCCQKKAYAVLVTCSPNLRMVRTGRAAGALRPPGALVRMRTDPRNIRGPGTLRELPVYAPPASV